ncbi:MAG: hypothetical protein KQ78_01809 [Candidatus Izimaplasma bacterium HR2]|nr:MAG: hypothetical protein KQ78_01809 [Candidatus Izimaplasma bacterium HR2]
MAKLYKKKEQLVNSLKGRLRKTLVETNLADYSRKQARTRGDIFFQSWKGYFDNQFKEALAEDGKRKLLEIITKKGK